MNHATLNLFLISLKYLVPVWTNIINKSIEEVTVLKYWKEAIVHPVQKNHSLGTNHTNYRPISNLTLFSKTNRKNNF